MENEIILLNVSGQDKPGLTSSLTKALTEYGAKILDIGQANIHNTLSLGILFEIKKNSSSAPVLKDLLFKSYELGINAKFTPVSIEEYEEWVSSQGKNRYIITLLGEKLDAEQISAVTSVISDINLNIDAIKRLTGRISLVKKNNKVLFSVKINAGREHFFFPISGHLRKPI